MATKKKVAAHTNGHEVISFDKFRTVDPGSIPKKVFIDTLNGYFYVKPVSSMFLQKFYLVEGNDNKTVMEVCHEIANYFAGNVFADPEGTKPIATYEQWMSLTPQGLIEASHIVQRALAQGGKEKNA